MVAINHDVLIARHVVPDPHKPGPIEVRLRDSGYSVWAVIGGLISTNGDLAQLAREYELSDDELAAALAYYRAHKEIIEARLSELSEGRPIHIPTPV